MGYALLGSNPSALPGSGRSVRQGPGMWRFWVRLNGANLLMPEVVKKSFNLFQDSRRRHLAQATDSKGDRMNAA